MEAPERTLIQFACGANQTVDTNLFTKYFWENINQENVDITEIFQQIADDVRRTSGGTQRPLCMNKLPPDEHIFLNQIVSGTFRLTTKISPTRKSNSVVKYQFIHWI